MKKIILFLIFIALAITSNAQCSQLFISEYGEPNGGNGKYVEIYNPTSSAIDLSNYEFWRVSNGGTWPEATLALSGNLAGFATYVVANNAGDVPGADEYNSGFCGWNGNDAVGLALSGILIDAVGEDGANPGSAGWDVAGTSGGTKNHTLVRKATVSGPNSNWATSAGTNASDSEWEVLTYGTGNVGSHTSECFVGACTLTISQSDESSCNDNGTGADATDDWFNITFNASSTSPGALNSFQVVLSANADGTGGTVIGTSVYGSAISIGDASSPPFMADGATTYSITLRDADDNTCHADYTTAIVNSCSVFIVPCSQLFISEYGEPSSGNGKYIEIFNPTATPISLTDYEIWKISNGGSWPESTFDLTGTIAAYSTYLIANNDTNVPGADVYASGIINFNGDDAMGLAYNGNLIDAVGTDGGDPGSGWDVAGVTNATKNHTLVRKEGVDIPSTNWSASAGTNTTDSEWIVQTYSIDNINMHTSACAPCSILLTENSESTCDENGTPLDGTDDWFTLTINADGANAGITNKFEIVLDANADGTGGTVLGSETYGTALTVGDASIPPFMADGTTTYSITIRDIDENTCHTDYTTNAVASCFIPSGITISCSGNMTVPAEPDVCEAIVNFAIASAVDVEDGAIPASSIVQTEGPTSGSAFPVGNTTITFSATDSDMNVEYCSFVITVTDNQDPTAICQDITIELDSGGLASITIPEIDNGSFDNCGGFTLGLSKTDFTCNDLGDNSIILTVTDASNNTDTCTATVTVEDNIAPVISCASEPITDVNSIGDNPSIAIPDNDTNGISTTIEVTQDVEISQFAVLLLISHTWVGDVVATLESPEGTTVTLIDRIGYDGSGFGCSEDDIFAILADDDFTGNTPIGPIEDACPPMGTYFPQSALAAFNGENTLGTWTLTVSDNAAGDTGTIEQWAIGYSYELPYTPLELNLDANGTLSIPASDLIASVDEACSYNVTEGGDANVDFDCSNLGENQIEIKVTDEAGNEAICTASVNISDVTAPVLVCEDTTIELGADGTATIDPYSLMSSWNEPCGIDTILTDVTEVSCADIGTPILVSLFANDASGNFSSCQSTITVVDLLAPELTCPGDINVPSNNNGMYEIPDYFALGTAFASDNCTDASSLVFTQNPAPETLYGITDGTANPPVDVVFTATDAQGNVATCSFVLEIRNGIGVSENIILTDALSIYPNPATDFVTIKNNSTIKIETAFIYDLNGKFIKEIDLQSTLSFTITNFVKGIYMVKIIGENATTVKKLIIE